MTYSTARHRAEGGGGGRRKGVAATTVGTNLYTDAVQTCMDASEYT